MDIWNRLTSAIEEGGGDWMKEGIRQRTHMHNPQIQITVW